MDEDLIVVDDVEPVAAQPTAGPSRIRISLPASAPDQVGSTPALRKTTRLRTPSSASLAATAAATAEANERTTRSSASRSKPAPKLKFKLSEKAAAQAPGMSFLGQYDRELDSDDEELSFEEQFILRMPPGDDCERLRKMISSREIPNDVWFKFRDSRRATFYIGTTTYNAKLVDLPCIVESQKTLDNKHLFKVADICQMLVVEPRQDSDAPSHNIFNIDEFIWPHGITPPLHHVRKRRFRKRINKRTIENVEQEVERLLEEDALANQVKYDVLDNVNPDLSDSEFIEREEPLDAPTPAMSDMADAQTPRDDGDEESESSSEEEQEGDIDEELAAELDLALGDEEEGDDEEEEDSEEEEDEEDDEASQSKRLLNSEIRDLEAAVAKKEAEIASASNPLIKRRFEDAFKKLSADLEMKRAQRDEMTEQEERMKDRADASAPQESEDDNSENGDAGNAPMDVDE